MTTPDSPSDNTPDSTPGSTPNPDATPDTPTPDSTPYPGSDTTPYPGSVANPTPATGATPPPAAAPGDQYQTTPYQLPGQSAQGGPNLPPPVNYQARTNPTSVVALILGFLVPLGGIIAGIIALGQIRRTQEKGRGLAIGGIAVGSFLTLLYIALGIALFVFGSIAAQTATTDPLLGGDPTSELPLESEAPIEETPGAEAPVEEVPVFTVAIGECYGADLTVLDCATPHDYEVYAQQPVAEAATYPGEDAVYQSADEACLAAFPAFAGIGFDQTTLGYSFLGPTAETWDEGDRQISCFIYDPAGQVTGTLAGAAR
jgi:hypothetical protein